MFSEKLEEFIKMPPLVRSVAESAFLCAQSDRKSDNLCERCLWLISISIVTDKGKLKLITCYLYPFQRFILVDRKRIVSDVDKFEMEIDICGIRFIRYLQIVSLTELMAGVKAPTKTVRLFQLTCFPLGHKVSADDRIFLQPNEFHVLFCLFRCRRRPIHWSLWWIWWNNGARRMIMVQFVLFHRKFWSENVQSKF